MLGARPKEALPRRYDAERVEAWAREEDPYRRKCGGMARKVSKGGVLLRKGEGDVQAEAAVEASNHLSGTEVSRRSSAASRDNKEREEVSS